MIIRFKEHNHYSRNIKISVIFSELLIICAFLLSPNINHNKNLKFSEPLIFIDDIPATIQPAANISKEPKMPEIYFDEEIVEPVILDDIITSKTDQQALSVSENVTDTIKLNIAVEPSPPRQLLEVLPDNMNYSGSLKLKLKIDSSGKVADYVILFNSIDCEDCLKEIISAVYKSQWKPARKNGSETEFWVEKSYTFN